MTTSELAAHAGRHRTTIQHLIQVGVIPRPNDPRVGWPDDMIGMLCEFIDRNATYQRERRVCRLKLSAAARRKGGQ